uniref:M-T7 protein n=1 Tax=Myxoma virus TaxID=10273 RepID=Q85296_9POXV|nr:M-T7 protein [Myxoma virus]
MDGRLVFLLASLAIVSDAVRLTSYDLNTFVTWQDDGYTYNVSIKPYTTATWINVCEWASSSCNVSLALQYDLDVVSWARLTRVGGYTEYSLEPTCAVARFSPPEVQLVRTGTSVEVLVRHPVVYLRGQEVSVYGHSFCDYDFGYKTIFLFSKNKRAEYVVPGRYCDNVECRFSIDSQESVCATAVLTYGDSYRSEAGVEVCVPELAKREVSPYIVKKSSDLEYVKRAIHNEYRLDTSSEGRRLEELYLTVASMFERLVEDVFE